MFAKRYHKRNDYALWLKVLRDKNCSGAYGLSEVLASYRLRSESVSHGGRMKLPNTGRLFYEQKN